MVHTCNSSTRNAKAERLSWVQGQPQLQVGSGILCPSKNKRTNKIQPNIYIYEYTHVLDWQMTGKLIKDRSVW